MWIISVYWFAGVGVRNSPVVGLGVEVEAKNIWGVDFGGDFLLSVFCIICPLRVCMVIYRTKMMLCHHLIYLFFQIVLSRPADSFAVGQRQKKKTLCPIKKNNFLRLTYFLTNQKDVSSLVHPPLHPCCTRDDPSLWSTRKINSCEKVILFLLSK
jgi:hypothetical protein